MSFYTDEEIMMKDPDRLEKEDMGELVTGIVESSVKDAENVKSAPWFKILDSAFPGMWDTPDVVEQVGKDVEKEKIRKDNLLRHANNEVLMAVSESILNESDEEEKKNDDAYFMA